MNLEHAIIALTKEVHGLAEQVHILTGQVSVLTGRVDSLTDQVRHQGVRIDHLDAKMELLIDGYSALDNKIDDFRVEVNERFKEVDYKFEIIFEDIGTLRKEFYAFCHG